MNAPLARIQIVEDERIVALDLKMTLEALGYEISGMAASEGEAVRTVEETLPDLVLMDINLGSGGLGTRAASEIHRRFGVPIIFLTAYAEGETLDRAQESLPFGYLLKPFELRELKATLQMALARHAAELRTLRAERRLRLALDVARIGVFEWDGTVRSLEVDGHLLEVLGAPPQAVQTDLGELMAYIHPDDRLKVGAVLSGEDEIHLTVKTVRDGGVSGWADINARSFRDSRGHLAVVGVLRDVTARHRAEQQLRHAGVVFECTSEGILLLDAERRILSGNPAFTQITGFSVDEATGRRPDEFLHRSPHSDRFYELLVASGVPTWEGEIECLRKDGRPVFIWERVTAVIDATSGSSHFVLTFADLTALQDAETRASQLAFHDVLTDLPNRFQMNEWLTAELERHRRAGSMLGLLFIDLDGFKFINDSMGHGAGDALLRTVARRLQETVRQSDFCARFSADEFVVVLTEIAGPASCAVLAQKLIERIAQPVTLQDQVLRVSASAGIATYPRDAGTIGDLVKCADSALHHAKGRGWGSFDFYAEGMGERTIEKMRIEQTVRRTVERGAMELHWQPIFTLATGRLCGFEALARLPADEDPDVGPSRFIPVAEETGLIVALGAQVLRAACAQGRTWLDQCGARLRIAANVSAREMADDGFDRRVREILHATGFPPDLLELEITESTLVTIEHIQPLLATLRASGVHIAIDDFGTGFSSLVMLKHLPLDRLKIDQSFVHDLEADVNVAAIVRSTVSMGKSLGLRITAEGIENAGQAGLLNELDCEDGQGFLFSQPLPAATATALLEDFVARGGVTEQGRR